MASEDNGRCLGDQRQSTNMNCSTPAPKTPAQKTDDDQSHQVRVGDRTSDDVIPTPATLNPRQVNSQQSTPRPRNSPATSSQPTNSQSQTPRLAIQQDATETRDSPRHNLPEFATPRLPLRQQQHTPHQPTPDIWPPSSWPNEGLTPKTLPNLSKLPPKMKRFGSGLSDAPNKRQRNTNRFSAQGPAEDEMGDIAMYDYDFNNGLQKYSNDPRVRSHQTPGVSSSEREPSRRGDYNGNSTKQIQKSKQNRPNNDYGAIRLENSLAPETSQDGSTMNAAEIVGDSSCAARNAATLERLGPLLPGLSRSSISMIRQARPVRTDLGQMEFHIDESEFGIQPMVTKSSWKNSHNDSGSQLDHAQVASLEPSKLSAQQAVPSNFENPSSESAGYQSPGYDQARDDRVLQNPNVKRALENWKTQEEKSKTTLPEEIPKTLSRLRDRSRSVAPKGSSRQTPHLPTPQFQTPGPRTPNNRSAATLARVTPRERQAESVALEENGLEEDATPLLDFWKNQRIARSKARKSSSNAPNILPPDHLKIEHPNVRNPDVRSSLNNYDYSTHSRKAAQPKNPGHSNDCRHRSNAANPQNSGHPSTKPSEIIDLSFTPEAVPVKRSVPIKERIAPAKKPVAKEANISTPRAKKFQVDTVDLVTPKTPKRKKAKEPIFQEDPEILRQKQAAALIIHKEIDTQRVELDNALFGEADAESELAKAQRLEAEAAKKKERDAQLLIELIEEEKARCAAIEKKRLQAEELLARKQQEAQEQEARRLKREVERKKEEQALQLALEEKREKTIAKIKADREAAEREAAEKERVIVEAAEKAASAKAQAEKLAKLKAKQELAKKQALSLTGKKVQAFDKEAVETLAPVAPAPSGNGRNEDVDVPDLDDEEDEDSLFVSEKPKRPDKTFSSRSSGANNASSPVPQTANQAALAQLRQETQAQAQAQRDETARRIKAKLDARLNRRVAEAERTGESVNIPPRVQQREIHGREVQPRERPAPAKAVKKKPPAPKPVPKPAQKLVQESDEDEDDEEFAWSKKRPAPSKPAFKPVTENAEASEKPNEPIQESNLDEDVLFTWSPISSLELECRSSIEHADAQSAPSQASQTSPSFSSHSSPPPAPASAPAESSFSNSLSTLRDPEDPQPSSPIFQANLRQISQRSQQKQEQERRNAEAAEKKKATAKSSRTEQQKADRRRKEVEAATKKAAEKKRLQIIAEAEKNGFDITPDGVRAQVEIFMAKREKGLQKRSERRAQKLAEASNPPQKRAPAQKKPPNTTAAPQKSNRTNGSLLNIEQALRKKTGIDMARKEKQAAIARERGNIGFLAAAKKTTVADFETDSESDEDEEDDDGLAAAIRDAFLEGQGQERDADDNSDSEFDSEFDDDDSEFGLGRARESLTHECRFMEPQPLLPLQDSINPASHNDSKDANSQLKRTSLLPKNILDAPPFKPRSMSSHSHPHELILVNIYRVMQTRTKGNETPPGTLVDNYGLVCDAEARIHLEVHKFRTSGIQIESSFVHKDEDGRDRGKIVHSGKKSVITEFFIKVETRLADTLSGYDAELFTPVVQKKVWNVVRYLLLKDTAPEYATEDSSAEESGDVEVIDLDAEGKTPEAVEGVAEGIEQAAEGIEGAAEGDEAPTEITELEVDEEGDTEIQETQNQSEPAEAQSEFDYQHTLPQPTFAILSTFTSLPMANNFACEAMIQIIKPKSSKMDEIEMHNDAVRQLRGLRDDCNESAGYFEASAGTDGESLPWTEWDEARIGVVEQELVGPLN